MKTVSTKKTSERPDRPRRFYSKKSKQIALNHGIHAAATYEPFRLYSFIHSSIRLYICLFIYVLINRLTLASFTKKRAMDGERNMGTVLHEEIFPGENGFPSDGSTVIVIWYMVCSRKYPSVQVALEIKCFIKFTFDSKGFEAWVFCSQ